MDEELAYADIRALRRERVTASRLVQALLDRIGTLDVPGTPVSLGSILAISPDALEEAARLDSANPGRAEQTSKPLYGVPVLVKDNIEVAGLPSTAGSTSLAGRPPASDAPLVRRLKEAGAVVLGTTNLSEWANIRSSKSTSGWSAVGGLTSNPWALDRNAGGSSSGSGAALAAGFAPLAVGTETDGSITCPASLNGVAGLKPSVGAVPVAGVVPVSASQDSPGPMARTIDDVALLAEVMLGVAGIVERSGAGIAGLEIAVAANWETGHRTTDDLFDETLERLRAGGAILHEVTAGEPSGTDREDELTVLLCELLDGMAAYLPTRGASGPQDLAEVVAHEDSHSSVELAHFGHDLFERAIGLGGTGTEAYREARRRNLQWALGRCLEPALSGREVLVAPTYGPAWKSDLVLGDNVSAASPVTMAPAIAGWPIATAPMGLADGLPVGFGAVGRPGSEAVLLAVCRAVEQPARPTWRPESRG
ncbi:MAG TPA: amidase family protein [Acidimicrobiales bacterium]|nr:amidase family protein [Acidimicrobiales bacterium]